MTWLFAAAHRGYFLSSSNSRGSLNGDNPCDDCGTTDNIIWFTAHTLWNTVVREDPERDFDPILCVLCFVKAVERRGFQPTGWLLLPDWPYTQVGQRHG